MGLLWGIGHGLGTLLISALLLAVTSQVDLNALSSWGERIAGLALIGMALMGYRRAAGGAHAAHDGSALTVGLIHGVTGAAALLLALPVLLSRGLAVQVCFLVAFAAGSALAMAGMTWLIARAVRGTGHGKAVHALRHVAAVLSVMLGTWWIVQA